MDRRDRGSGFELVTLAGTMQRGTVTFNHDSHRIVVGVAYHFYSILALMADGQKGGLRAAF